MLMKIKRIGFHRVSIINQIKGTQRIGFYKSCHTSYDNGIQELVMYGFNLLFFGIKIFTDKDYFYKSGENK